MSERQAPASSGFQRFAGASAIGVGIGGIAYSIVFVLPNAIDPYGLLTFALAGLAIALFGWLIRRDPAPPRRLGTPVEIAGVLLILVYLGRFFIFDPSNPALLAIAAIAGVVANPAWYIWLGRTLRRGT